MRAYIRYAPLAAGKSSFWRRVVDPYFAWHSHEFVASTMFGSKIAGNTNDIIPQYIYYFGLWEPHLTRWIQRRLAPGDTFIDVGANIGYMSLLASQLVGDSGTVVAIEPSPTIVRALHGNLARNRADNVRVVDVAASDSHGRVKVFHGPHGNIGMTTTVDAVASKQGFRFECEVDSAPLSAILTADEMQSARLIKIDVEGAEWSVVGGMGEMLSSCRSDLEIMVEVNPEFLAQQEKQPKDILSVFGNAGFHVYSLENDYSAQSYLTPQTEKRPVRIRNPIECGLDLVFSRQSSEWL